MFKFYFLLPFLAVGAFFCPNFGRRYFHKIERALNCLASSTRRSVVAVGALSMVISLVLAFFAHIPPPQTHDEFGYLLLADTFAHGRLSNPTHPLWQHFESMHIIQQPTYSSKYPPAQGVALAVGQVVFGNPIVGVWLSTALACATVCWMLFAWVPRRWALLGGILVALHPQTLTWSQCYWGGAVAMGGGALLSGAFRRIVHWGPRIRDSLLMGLGMGILANSRPYEGFVLSLLIIVSLLIWMLGSRGPAIGVSLCRIVLPLAAVALAMTVQIGYYNYRVTGNPVLMPYVVHEQTYGVAPLFIWQKPKPEPVFRHKPIHDMQVNSYLAYYKWQRSAKGVWAANYGKLFTLSQAFLWSYLLAVPLLALPWAVRKDGWAQFALVILILFTIAMFMGTWVFPHYAAPALDLFFVLVLFGMRQMQAWEWRGQRTGLFVARGIVLLCVITVGFVIYRLADRDYSRWDYQRARILADLNSRQGKHLIVVRYQDDHNPHREWVYNPADIDGAKVLFAREMSAEDNQKLIEYFQDRKIWSVDADSKAPELTPYVQ